ncbi:hypothetical protein Y032_0146g2517 [Ancylostoma ceylanicum]|nr:hypothetical protein Y032_0146g2517 [Ancylostoma ceylanicum]
MIRGTAEDRISNYNSTTDLAIWMRFGDMIRVYVFFLLLDIGVNCFQAELPPSKCKSTVNDIMIARRYRDISASEEIILNRIVSKQFAM